MERQAKLILLLGFLLIGTFGLQARQTATEKKLQTLESVCIKALPAGASFLKGFPASIVGQNQQWVEYSLSLQAGGVYVFTVADLDQGDNKGAVVFLYDKKQHKMATNYHNDKMYNSFEFHCQATGLYKLFIAFKDSGDHLGYVVMGKK